MFMESCLIKEKHVACVLCTTHQEGYEIIKKNIQQLINHGILQIKRAKGRKDISTLELHFELPKPFEIFYQKEKAQ